MPGPDSVLAVAVTWLRNSLAGVLAVNCNWIGLTQLNLEKRAVLCLTKKNQLIQFRAVGHEQRDLRAGCVPACDDGYVAEPSQIHR